MKIKLTNEAKKAIPMYYADLLPKIQYDFSEDDILEYCHTLVSFVSGENAKWEFLKCHAEFALNGRIFNQYSEDSGHIDIWIECYAYNPYYGFFDLGAYLTDIWSIGSEDPDKIKSHIYINTFTKN